MELNQIEEQAKKLAEQSSWVRHGAEKLMQAWYEASESVEEIESSDILDCNKEGAKTGYRLVTGCRDIVATGFDGEGINPSRDQYFWNALSMPRLRIVLMALPGAMTEISDKMAQSGKDNDKVLAIMGSFGKIPAKTE